MEMKNYLNEVPIASLDEGELTAIKELERKLGDNYYIIAFQKKG